MIEELKWAMRHERMHNFTMLLQLHRESSRYDLTYKEVARIMFPDVWAEVYGEEESE